MEQNREKELLGAQALGVSQRVYPTEEGIMTSEIGNGRRNRVGPPAGEKSVSFH